MRPFGRAAQTSRRSLHQWTWFGRRGPPVRPPHRLGSSPNLSTLATPHYGHVVGGPSSSSSGRGSPWASVTPRLLKPPVPAASDDSVSLNNDSRYYYHTGMVLKHSSELLHAVSDHLGPGTDSTGTGQAGTGAVSDSHPSYQFSHGACGIPKRSAKRRAASSTPAPGNGTGNGAGGGGPAEPDFLSVGCGEDAYFCRHDSLGVADGVGGWEGVKNANPALFSRKLMHYSYIEVEKYENIEDYEFVHYYDINPVDILRKSYTQVLEDAYVEGIRGSSTACLAILRDDELRVANLGDCGLAVVRRGEFVFRTEEQQHSFNFPYQIGTGCADRPEDAQVFAFKVQRGDIILVGSDGLFDNLFDEDILEEIQRYVPQPTTPATPSPPTLPPSADAPAGPVSRTLAFLKPSLLDANRANPVLPAPAPTSESPSATAAGSLRRLDSLSHINPGLISEAIARRAKSVSEESRFTTSPFQNRAMQEGFYHQGGKPDDITVLIAVVADLEDSPDRR
ncbi:hypothetical protein H4R33_000707 [Dimargaris cristalligena]|nr:hypothetical protein H4R33_000707 [Dimargaris cristalligena]